MILNSFWPRSSGFVCLLAFLKLTVLKERRCGMAISKQALHAITAHYLPTAALLKRILWNAWVTESNICLHFFFWGVQTQLRCEVV